MRDFEYAMNQPIMVTLQKDKHKLYWHLKTAWKKVRSFSTAPAWTKKLSINVLWNFVGIQKGMIETTYHEKSLNIEVEWLICCLKWNVQNTTCSDIKPLSTLNTNITSKWKFF